MKEQIGGGAASSVSAAPMLRLEINLYSWERGDSEIEVVLPHGGELSDAAHNA